MGSLSGCVGGAAGRGALGAVCRLAKMGRCVKLGDVAAAVACQLGGAGVSTSSAGSASAAKM